jgi:hypothetical protein
MNKTFRLAAPLTLLLLSACGEKGKDAAQGSAGGEVLEGSISDAMLPLDTVRSQPPLAQQSGAPGGKASGAGNASGGDSASESQAPAPEGGGEAPAAAPEAPAATPGAE